MPQPSRDDREPQEVTDLDTARLALRGAVESLRSLQEVNQRLKGEIQEYSNRNKMLDQRLITLQTDLNVVNSKLDRQDDLYAKKEDAMRRSIRQEVSLEENQRWQAEMASLRQSIEMWKAAREQKEAELERLNQILSEREHNILELQKEKVVIQGKANQDLSTSLAKARDDLKLAIEAVILEKDKQLDAVKTDLTEDIHELETHLRAKEQEIQFKDENVAKQFHDRQKELSEFWAKREQEIWDRAKQAKGTMEAGLTERWEQRLEDLNKEFAEKTFLLEQNYANNQATLEQKEQALKNQVHEEEDNLRAVFTKRSGDLEQSHVERAASLEMQWNVREKEFTNAQRQALDSERAKFTDEVRKIKEESTTWMVARDADFHAKQTELRQRHQGLEKELREAWGKREETLTLRHAAEIKNAQETLSQTLRDKLGAAAEEYRKQMDSLQLHLAEVDKKYLDQESELRVVRDRAALAEKERAQLAQTLEVREASARKLLEEKEKTWTATHESLRKQSLESAEKSFQENEAQKLRIADLEKHGADASARLAAQQDRIQNLDKERTTLSETLQEREATLHSELDVKERLWASANEALRQQLATLTSESVHRTETHRGRISDLEKRCEAQASEFTVLQKQHVKLESERVHLAQTLQERETVLRSELDAKQREWKSINDALQDQLSRVSNESAHTNEAQLARISELERQSLEAMSQVKILQQKLQALDKERATLTEALQTNEALFRKQLEEREGEWAALNGSLQQQLAALTRETSEKIAGLQELAAGLEKQKTEITAHARSLESQLQNLQREHGQLGETLRVREAALLKELEVKRGEWRAVQETLQDQLKKVTGESAHRNEVQLGRIADLETQQLEARSEIKLLQQKIQHFEEERTRLLSDMETQSQQALQKQEAHQAQVSGLEHLNNETRARVQELQEKLHGLEKERETLAETLQARETDLRQQLEEKDRAWAAAKEAYQQQMDILKRDTSKRDEAQLAQIAHLDKERAEIKTQWLALRDRLHNLEKTRQETADKLEAQEKAFRLEIIDKDRTWTATREALQEQLTTQAKASAHESAIQLSRIAELEKRAADAETYVAALKEKLQGLDKERAGLSLTLQNRESVLLQQLDEKERAWAKLRDSLEEKLAGVTADAAQKHQAQQDVAVELEAHKKAAAAQALELRAKLETLGKDRDSLAETLRVREAALHKELSEKQQAWEKNHNELQEQLARLKKSSSGDNTAQQGRIADLEKQNTAADKYIIGLKDKLQALDNERAAQAHSFQARERDLHLQMEEKNRLWGQAKDLLDEKLKVLSRESAQTQQAQKAMISDLEVRHKEAAALISSLQQKLSGVEKERDQSAETLRSRESALQKDLADKEQAWTRAEQALQDALASQSKAAVQDSAAKASRILELEKNAAEAGQYIQALREKLQVLDKERLTLSAGLQNRERDLRQQLDEKEHAWTLTKDALEERLAALLNQSAQTQQAQRESILVLETRQKEAAAMIASLQEKLAGVEKDRNVTADTLRSRETALLKELTDKEQAWTRAQQALQEALANQKKSSSYDSAVKESRIVELEKSAAEAEKYAQVLRDKLQVLDKERLTLSAGLQNRERDLRQQLDEKEHAWTLAKDSLEEKLAALSQQSTQTQQAQRDMILALETRQKEAAELVASLQEKLATVEKDRNVTVETLRSRENALQKELNDKEQAWNRAQQALQEALSSQKKAAVQDSTVKESRIIELEKSAADAAKYIETLRDKLQVLDKERLTLSTALQNRERDLRHQLEEKEHTWTLAKDSLEEKLAALSQQSIQTHQAQQDAIAALEVRQKEAAAFIASLQEKLADVQKERNFTVETLRTRESVLQKELTEKEQVWNRAQQVLQEALSNQKKMSAQDSTAKESRIVELEKSAAEAGKYIETLRDKLQVLDKERLSLSATLQTRERELRLQLGEKEHAWTLAKDVLEEKLAGLSHQSAQIQQAQRESILILETRQKKAGALIASLQEKLAGVEKDRDVTSETLRSRENTLLKELADKEQAWAQTQKTLQDALANQKKTSTHDSAIKESRIIELEKSAADAAKYIDTLRDKLQVLDKERLTLSTALQNRERDLRQQLDEKEHAWTLAKDTLEEKLAGLSQQSTQTQQAQRDAILALETRQKEAAALIASLQEKLATVEKDRNVTAETLRSRESALLKELTDKEQAWNRAQQALQEALSSQKKAAVQDSALKESRIDELEKNAAEAEKYIQTLRDKLQVLDKERTTLSLALQNRERDLRQQLDEKEHAWTVAKDTLEEKLAVLSLQSTQIQQGQKESILELETRQKQAATLVASLQARLDEVQQDRDAKADLLRVREAALNKELAQKQAAWEKIQKNLQEELEQLRKSSAVQTSGQHERILELETRNAAADTALAGLREKLQILDKDRVAQAQAFQVRERNLHLEIEEKTRAWSQVKETLEENLKRSAHEAVQTQQAQKALISEMEIHQKDAATQIAKLQERLANVEKDRDASHTTLRVHESALQKELSEKQQAWQTLRDELQEQLTQLQTSSGIQTAAQREHILELEKRNGDAESTIAGLKVKLQALDKERAVLAQTAQNRERDLQLQMEEKTHALAQVKHGLEERLKALSHESSQIQLSQKALIADLEIRQKEAAAQVASLQEKLGHVEKDRDVTSTTLQTREAALQKELSEKQQTWQALRDDLQEQLTDFKKSSAADIAAREARIVELEKQNAAAEKQVALLKDKTQSLDKERASLSVVSRDKESQLRQQLDENTQAWLHAKGLLEEKLANLSRESSQTQKLQQNRIAEFEKQVASTAAEMDMTREKLQNVLTERDALAETLRVREKTLRSEMTEKEQVWEKARAELQVQLAEVSTEAVRQSEDHKSQIIVLNQRNAEALTLIRTFQTQLQNLHSERQALADTLQTREAALRGDLERKQHEWTAVKTTLEQQIEKMGQESALRNAAQQSELRALEKQGLEAGIQTRTLNEKLQALEKERRMLTEKLETREASLREELHDKESTWSASEESLKEQLAVLKRDASKKDQSQQAQIAALERQSADAKAQATGLREQLSRLDSERRDVSAKLDSREQTFRTELAEKERASASIHEALEMQLTAFKKDVQQKSIARENRILELEKISTAAAAEAQFGREQLQKLEAERDIQLDAIRNRELALRRELTEKEQAWNRTQHDLQEQLSSLSSESTREREEQQAHISDLSRRQAEAQGMVKALQEKLQALEKERDAQAGSLNAREASLRTQLEKIQTERDDFKDQLTHLRADVSKMDSGRRAQITELEKQSVAAETESEALRARLHRLEKERESIDESLKLRERGYARELEQKQGEWDAARSELHDQLTRLKKEAAQKSEVHKAQLADVESTNSEAQATLQALRERVHILEKERDALKEDVDQRENNLEKRRAALEKTMRQREQELEQRTQRMEEELRQAWIGKERALNDRVQSSFEKEQALFQDKLHEFQAQSKDQIIKLQSDQEDIARRKKDLEQQKADHTARFEQRDHALSELENKTREDVRRQLAQLETEKAEWTERLKGMEVEQSDLERRQAQVQSREVELDRLREQLTASLDAPGSHGKPAAQGVQSLVEEWVFGFAHQVRNPLGIIRSMTESMMLTRVSGKAQRDSFVAILQAVDGLARRLGEFIDFSKPVKVSLRNTLLSEVAQSALATIQDRARQEHVEIHTRFDEKTPSLMLDPEQLQTALQHLLTNALEAMSQGGSLTIEVRPDSGGAVVRILDTGSGISVAHMKEIGKPFFSTKTGHIGLGLAGAKRILHSLGAEMSFDSRPGQGATVTCRFKAKGK